MCNSNVWCKNSNKAVNATADTSAVANAGRGYFSRVLICCEENPISTYFLFLVSYFRVPGFTNTRTLLVLTLKVYISRVSYIVAIFFVL